MAKDESPRRVHKPKSDAPQEPGDNKAGPKNRGRWCFWRRPSKDEAPWESTKDDVHEPHDGGNNKLVTPDHRNQEPEERRATSAGPQIFSLVVDHSGSMEQSGSKEQGSNSKAKEATRVLREVIQYAQAVNTTTSQTGKKIYFYTQIVLFAEQLQDSTNGMSCPPDEFLPEEAYTVRHPKSRERLGNRTNFQLPLAHVYKTLAGKQGMTKARLDAGMPAPIVLFITDGKPNLPEPEDMARRLALQEADRLKSITLPTVQCFHPVREQIVYDQTNVRLITIGLGNGPELDQGLLEQLCTHVQYRGEDLPLYLHCPQAKDLQKIGARIVGTVTTPGETNETLEEVIYALRHSTGTQGP